MRFIETLESPKYVYDVFWYDQDEKYKVPHHTAGGDRYTPMLKQRVISGEFDERTHYHWTKAYVQGNKYTMRNGGRVVVIRRGLVENEYGEVAP